ncbi:MAG: flippase-like domain-containing protein [Deltaproteobacteria bacterium]|nr:flippase-like domain-containing protein [Deltaproteobacteria bacterium]
MADTHATATVRQGNSTMANIVRSLVLLGITVAVFSLLYIFKKDQFLGLADKYAQARLTPFFALMAVYSLFYFLFDTLVLSAVMRWFHGPISYTSLLPVRAVTYLVSVVNPQLAQGALILYLSRRERKPILEITSSILFMGIVEISQLLLYASFGMLLVGGRGIPRVLFLAPVVLVVMLGVIFGLFRRQSGPSWAVARTFRLAPLSRYGQLVLLKAPIFFAALFVHYFALQLFGIFVPLGQLLPILPVVFLSAALPSFMHSGFSQAAWVTFLGAYDPQNMLLAYSLAAHVTFMACNGGLGALFLRRAYSDLFGVQGTEEQTVSPRTAIS